MPRIGRRFSALMTCVRLLEKELKGKIKGVEVIQNFAECPKDDQSIRPFVYVEYNERYFKETNVDNPNHPDNLIKDAAKHSGLTKLFKYAGEEFVEGRRDIGFELKESIKLA